jgi:hypothetical protein
MFHVVTVNLANDSSSASPAHGAIDVGELTPAEFTALLERFRRLDSIQNHEADPHLLVTTRAGKFCIRTGQGKLSLGNARSTVEPFVEHTADEIIRQLEHVPSLAVPLEDDRAGPAKSSATPHRGIAVAILIAGLALNGYTLYSVFYTETVNEKPAVKLLTDPAEVTAHQNDVIGTFATGDQPGDRTISVENGGRIRFSQVGAPPGYNGNADTFHLGRLGKNYCLNTVESGVIEVMSIDTLIYYRDTYKRTK